MDIILLSRDKLNLAADKLDIIFKVFFLIFGLLNFNPFFICQPVMSVVVIIATALAGILLIYRIANWRYFVNNKILWLLIAFLASYAISVLLNYNYGIMIPLKTSVWMGMQYLLLFATDSRKDLDYHKKQIKILSFVYLIYIFLMNVLSLIFLVSNYYLERNVITDEGKLYTIRGGYHISRLWGAYSDPNYGSVLVVIAIILSVYFFITLKNKYIKIALVVNIIIGILYNTFSDSRTGMVAGIAAFGTVAYYLFYKSNLLKSKLLKNVAALSLAVIVALTYTASMKLIKSGYREILYFRIEHMNDNDKNELLSIQQAEKEREEYIKGDISNRRFDLWKSSLDIIRSKPLFGVTFNNVQEYTEDNFPENYLINNNHGKYDNYHNAFINVAAGQGIVGFSLVIIIALLSVIIAVKKIYNNINTDNALLYIIILGILIASFCGAMFVSDLVYVNSATATLFWYLLGVAVSKDEKEVIK